MKLLNENSSDIIPLKKKKQKQKQKTKNVQWTLELGFLLNSNDLIGGNFFNYPLVSHTSVHRLDDDTFEFSTTKTYSFPAASLQSYLLKSWFEPGHV